MKTNKEKIEKLEKRRANILRLFNRSNRMADKYYDKLEKITARIIKLEQ